MALPEKVNEVFKEDPDTLNTLKALDEAATKATEYENTIKAFGNITPKDIEALKATNADLIAQRSKWKTDKDNVVPLADHNAILEKFNTLQASVEALTTENKQTKEEAARVQLEKVSGDLKTSVVTVASANKAIDPAQVHIIMQGLGLVGLKDGKPFYYTLNEKNEPVTATAETAVKWYLDKNKHLVSAGGAPGTGNVHRGSSNNQGNGVPDKNQLKRDFISGGR